MSWFEIFSKRKVDKDILELYFEIEILINNIEKKFNNYFYILNKSNFLINNKKDKSYYSIQKISVFIKRLKEDYGSCYTTRANKKEYNFHKSNNARAEKLEIEFHLKKIITILKNIYDYAESLDLNNFKNNDMINLNKYIENFLKNVEENVDKINKEFYLFKKIKERDEHVVFEIINAIVDEARNNAKKDIWLIDQKSKNKLLFSQNLSINNIKYLELVPILDMNRLNKRSLFINEMHKDETLPIYHYNLLIDGENIHVVPKNYQNKIKNYLSVA
jgi:uncharacterized protein with HEPN domain